MRKNTIRTLIILSILFMVLGSGYLLVSKTSSQKTNNNPTSPTIDSSNEVVLYGPILENDKSCNRDGVCKIKVDHYWVITNLGGDPTIEVIKKRGPKGSIISSNGKIIGAISDSFVGKTVKVYAKKIDDTTATLYGKSEYYVQFEN